MSEREILFRGKHYRTGEWIYGIPVKEPLSGSEDAYFPKIIPDRNGIHRSIDRASVVEDTVGQFTGLTDKNGTRIFEGDIVRYKNTLHEVVFCRIGGCAFFGITMPDRGEIWDFDGITRADRMEVIGNIHDNPELLEGE